ncbi:hypothetical protein [Photobacterium kishitanii]|nr:hypothetical protein [Photobacterium kishitanii]
MTPEEFEILSKISYIQPKIKASEFEDSTLLFGYDTDRITWHVYKANDKIHVITYSLTRLYEHNEYTEVDPALLIPNKRVYKESTSFDFAKRLVDGFNIHMTYTTQSSDTVGKKLPVAEDFRVRSNTPKVEAGIKEVYGLIPSLLEKYTPDLFKVYGDILKEETDAPIKATHNGKDVLVLTIMAMCYSDKDKVVLANLAGVTRAAIAIVNIIAENDKYQYGTDPAQAVNVLDSIDLEKAVDEIFSDEVFAKYRMPEDQFEAIRTELISEGKRIAFQ